MWLSKAYWVSLMRFRYGRMRPYLRSIVVGRLMKMRCLIFNVGHVHTRSPTEHYRGMFLTLLRRLPPQFSHCWMQSGSIKTRQLQIGLYMHEHPSIVAQETHDDDDKECPITLDNHQKRPVNRDHQEEHPVDPPVREEDLSYLHIHTRRGMWLHDRWFNS
ncbi:unnamed protein product [Citrullus colocynthis]|uniref:Uncharacterized protein n=1 Tax=Citrullus colocynthis TaxID=252529 RepID=A0ABP0Y4X9_9ROSI